MPEGLPCLQNRVPDESDGMDEVVAGPVEPDARMGAVSAEPLTFDVVDSHARLRGHEVEIVLSGLDEVRTEDARSLDLSRDGLSVTAPAKGAGTDVRARTPRSGLVDGQWSIALDGRPVAARLLVQGARPIVLLIGAKAPRSAIPPRRRVETPGLGRRVVRKLARTVRR